ncbi:MAG: DUF559 domain-containing protein [Sphingomonas sp.]|nr:DUF559 domain-containing protein [Sphingomonas sp.]MDX3883027.1 DUF559 domain-containing protein [Sphingomonas sp.]
MGDFARTLRRVPTPLEEKLWHHLRSSRLGGFKFRRQIVLDPYIVDFFCPAVGLIVELDGDSHDAQADARRDAALAARGFTTLRFTNRDVGENLEGVLADILRKASSLPPRFTHPPAPSLEREGGL